MNLDQLALCTILVQLLTFRIGQSVEITATVLLPGSFDQNFQYLTPPCNNDLRDAPIFAF